MRQNQTNGREIPKKNTLHAKLENQKHTIRTERKLTAKNHIQVAIDMSFERSNIKKKQITTTKRENERITFTFTHTSEKETKKRINNKQKSQEMEEKVISCNLLQKQQQTTTTTKKMLL